MEAPHSGSGCKSLHVFIIARIVSGLHRNSKAAATGNATGQEHPTPRPPNSSRPPAQARFGCDELQGHKAARH